MRKGTLTHPAAVAALAVVAIPAASAWASISPASARPPVHQVAFIGVLGPFQPAVRPTAIGQALATEVDHLVWGQWGPNKAVGKGLYLDCYTGCGPGSSGPQRIKMLPTTVTLTDPLRTSEGWLFNTITEVIKGEKPFTLDVLVPPSVPFSGVVLPAANMTGNYLWVEGLEYNWLSLSQSGTTVTGTEEDGAADNGQPDVSEYSISGVASAGILSLVLTPKSGSLGEPYTEVLDLVGVDLRGEGTTLVPASGGSYTTAWEAVERASHQ